MKHEECRIIAPVKLTESDIARQVDDFLAVRGWRRIKTHSHDAPTKSGARVPPERGMPDRLYLRYGLQLGEPEEDVRLPPEILWVEFKAPGKRLSADQERWVAEERARGAQVEVVDNLDAFMPRYRELFGQL